MRILTVRQPWAWAIVFGQKDVENRVRNLAGDYRGPIAIQAGAARFEDEGQFWEVRRAIRSLEEGYPASDGQVWASDLVEADDPRFVYGAIIGVVDLTGAHHAVKSGLDTWPEGNGPAGFESWCSPWAEPGVWHLQLANPRPLAEPIPFKGALGLRLLPDTITAQIEQQLALALAEGKQP